MCHQNHQNTPRNPCHFTQSLLIKSSRYEHFTFTLKKEQKMRIFTSLILLYILEASQFFSTLFLLSTSLLPHLVSSFAAVNNNLAVIENIPQGCPNDAEHGASKVLFAYSRLGGLPLTRLRGPQPYTPAGDECVVWRELDYEGNDVRRGERGGGY